MLRSRPNRQQRPSESSDERQGGYGYGGYPSSNNGGGGGGLGLASGADDYDSKAKEAKASRGMFGFGGGGVPKLPRNGGGRSGGSSFSNRGKPGAGGDVWDRKRMGSTYQPKGWGTGTGFLLLSMACVLLAIMGGATLHYKRAHNRLQHELMIAKRRMKGRRHMGGRFQRGDEPEEESEGGEYDAEKYGAENADLVSQLGDLRGESSKWTHRNTAMQHEVDAAKSQADHLQDGEMASHQSQLNALSQSLKEEQKKAASFKEAFVQTHRAGAKGIVPGGPGHAAVQRKAIEEMESLDDYEQFVQWREDALWDKVDLLVDKMGRTSRRETLEWFGPGPHFAELEIEYPQYDEDKDPEDWPRVRGVVEIEMAPLDLMPVAVNLFLQQVHRKLWNGCSFVINAMHILQAGPHRFGKGGKYDANSKDLVRRFERTKLDQMPFQEFHRDYPHKPYTLGFAGRPGGPDFYISKVDNSANHGPGGQSHHDLHEEADPCFGTVVKGQEVIKQIGRVPTDYDKGQLLLHPVVIVDSRVVRREGPTTPTVES
ncbi:hypothetical protein ACHAXT_003971 [Thalassiosira profunda]